MTEIEYLQAIYQGLKFTMVMVILIWIVVFAWVIRK